MHAACRERSIRFIDAAILSGVQHMYDGKSTLLVGGADEDVERARPLLTALTERQVRFGPVGSGMAAHTVYEIAVGSGLARQDYAAIAQLWEAWTGRTFGREPETT